MTKEELFRAVGEVREDQITEAEEVRRQSRPWRRYGTLAACLALVLAGAFALERLEDARKWAEIEESFQTADGAYPEIAPDADSGGEIGDRWTEKTDELPSEESPESGAVLDGADYWPGSGKDPASNYSFNVEIGELEGHSDEDGLGRTETGMSACLAWLSQEEIFAMDTVIFRGVVESSPRYYRIDMPGRDDYYCTAVNVRVTDSIRGGLEEGEVYSLMYGGAKGHMSLSTSGPLEELRTGGEGIFMSERTGPDTGWRTETGYFCYADLAELRIGEGIRFVFLDTEEGVRFDRSTYEEAAEAETLDEIADYIRRMIGETERTQPAAVPAEPQRDPAELDPALLDPSYGVEGPHGARELPDGTVLRPEDLRSGS